jgi:hypothetical protein
MLTEKEYRETMTDKMLDVTATAEPIVDIWPYVKQLTKDKIVLDHVYDNQLVETVYRNDTGTFDHVLLPADNSNEFVIIIVDLKQKKIKGHFRLDLNKEYGLKN